MKSILVIDTPNNCSECVLYDELPSKVCKGKSVKDNGNTIYWLLNHNIHYKKDPQCPLTDTSEEKER